MTLATRAAAAAALALLTACGAANNTATAPTITATPAPKITAPTPQSPVGGQLLGGLAATLNANAATVDSPSYTLQYRFQVINASGNVALDSGLVGSPQWTTPVALTPNNTYSWKVRAESQGFAGPWSDSASFRTPDPPPAYNRPIGDWQSCGSIVKKDALVACVWNAVHPTDSVSDMEVTKRVAWLLRGEGAGLLIKNGGEGVVLWQGYSFSAARVCYPNGQIYKILADAGPGGTSAPTWSDNGTVDKSLYVPAIDPSKP